MQKSVKSIPKQFSFISGDNHRTAKRKAKKAKEIVDLAASVNDIHDSLK